MKFSLNTPIFLSFFSFKQILVKFRLFSQIKHYKKTLQSFGDSLHFNFSYRKFIVKFLKEFPLNFIRQSKNLFLLYSTLPLLCLFLRSSSSSLFLFWLIYFLIFFLFLFQYLNLTFYFLYFCQSSFQTFFALVFTTKIFIITSYRFFYNFLFFSTIITLKGNYCQYFSKSPNRFSIAKYTL